MGTKVNLEAEYRKEEIMSKIKANGINVHYTLEGPGSSPVITLSHSLATDSSMWESQMEIISRPEV